MKTFTKAAFAAVSLAFAAQAAAQVIFYEREGFQGESFTASGQVNNFERFGFDNRASSAEVYGERWEVCEGPRFSGRCFVLRPGRYPSLVSMGMNNRLSSVRAIPRDVSVESARFAPDPFVAGRDYRRRGGERVYEANVTSVRAVVSAGPDQQRCWVDREQVSQPSRNVPGAVAGAIIGGIIGHQFGSGRGQDVATVGGAVAGGAVGSRIGSGGTEYRDVQRCEKVAGQPHTDYWDVTYTFRGTEHRVQMTAAPGPTVTVNEQGEPRGG